MMRAVVVFAVLGIFFSFSGCSGVGSTAAKLAAGAVSDAPRVDADVQLGRNNAQVLGVSSQTELSLHRPQARQIEQSSGETGLRADRVGNVVVNEAPPWRTYLVFGVVGLLALCLPSPVAGLFARFARRSGPSGLSDNETFKTLRVSNAN
jgi:hypothetical protein